MKNKTNETTTIEIFTAKNIHNANNINMYNRRKITAYYADKFADLPDGKGFMLLELTKRDGWHAWAWEKRYLWEGGFDADNSNIEDAEELPTPTDTRYCYDVWQHWLVAVKEEEFKKIIEED